MVVIWVRVSVVMIIFFRLIKFRVSIYLIILASDYICSDTSPINFGLLQLIRRIITRLHLEQLWCVLPGLIHVG